MTTPRNSTEPQPSAAPGTSTMNVLVLAAAVCIQFASGASPNPLCRVSAYGADPRNLNYSTRAVQAALDDCQSGGTVLFDEPGTYLMGAVAARGRVQIIVPEGVTLLAGSRVRRKGWT